MKSNLLILLAILLAGCSGIGNALIPPHPKSDIQDPDLTCLTFDNTDNSQVSEMGGEFVLEGASLALGWIIDQTASVIDKEASRYKSTFSARSTSDLYWGEDGALKPKLKSFTLARYHGAAVIRGCDEILKNKDSEKPELAFMLSGLVEYNNVSAIQLRPTMMFINQIRAKVPALTWWPHTWWRVFDNDAGKIDLALRASVVVVSRNANQVSEQEVMKVDLPLAKVKLAQQPQEISVSNLASGWAPLPPAKDAKTHQISSTLPATITMTIVESDSLGDVLADASKTIKSNKDKISQEIIKVLGLKK